MELVDARPVVNPHYETFVRDLAAFFERQKSSIESGLDAIWQGRIAALQARLAEVETQIEETRVRIDDTAQVLANKDIVMERIVAMMGKLHLQVRGSALRASVLRAWVNAGTDEPIAVRTFQKLTSVRTFDFKRWRRLAFRRMKGRLLREIRRKHDAELSARRAATTAVRTERERLLDQLRDQIDAQRAEFEALEARLRQAFMRGVVNVHLEALDVVDRERLAGEIERKIRVCEPGS